MDPQQIKQIQQALEAFFYKSRLNIAIHNIIRDQNYTDFKKRMEDALYRQVIAFATVESVNRVVGVNKAVGVLTDIEIMPFVENDWIPLLAIIEQEEMSGYLFWVAKKGGQSALNQLQSDKTFQLKDSALIRTIDNHGLRSLELIDETTKNWLARTVEQGLRDGMSHVEIAKMIRDNARRVVKERADVIAEHEAALILGRVVAEVFKRNGVTEHKWITSRDEAVCELCGANEAGGVVKLGELFPSGVTNPPQHQRCRCIDMPVLPKGVQITWTG